MAQLRFSSRPEANSYHRDTSARHCDGAIFVHQRGWRPLAAVASDTKSQQTYGNSAQTVINALRVGKCNVATFSSSCFGKIITQPVKLHKYLVLVGRQHLDES